MKMRALGPLAGLAVAFAAFLAMFVVLTGRLQAAGLTVALALGVLVSGVIVAGRPVEAVRRMDPPDRWKALAGGASAFFAAPAVVAAVRLSDAPAGSVVVFWMAGGWAALAALLAAALRLRARAGAAAMLAVAGGAAALAGAAAVVANWERPSSFSPLVRFPVQEAAIVVAGVLLLAGGVLVAHASHKGRFGGALVCGGAAALAAGIAWALVAGPGDALAAIDELPVQVAIAAVAWGAVCALLPRVLRVSGPGSAAASLAAAPVLISALTWVEQATGVMGPQPFAVGGVLAGALLVMLAIAALVTGPEGEGAWRPSLAARIVSFVPAVLAVAALALPAIAVSVTVTGSPGGTFSGSWILPGAESVAAWAALALALMTAALASLRDRVVTPLVGLAACAAWPMLLDVPTHVLNQWLSPGIQSYYGTEYGSIVFAHISNIPLTASVVVSAAGFAAIAAIRLLRRRPADVRGADASPEV